ncbi:MAG TPA: hypothetical protein VK171_11805 [Fimbriimonas sp.]|nr:hypothetical protein [Fimbriimonas sp.]
MIPLLAFACMSAEPKAQNWDWTAIIGTGQSLATGGGGFPIKSTTQPFRNLKLDTGDMQWPINDEDEKLSVVPLTEPVGRNPKGYPSSWPTNIDAETVHSSAGNQITALVEKAFGRDYVTVHVNVAEAGQGMVRIRKDSVREGVSGRAYEASLVATRAMARLARKAGKTFGVGAIFMTHGETDTGNAKYEEELLQLWSDYNKDLKAITGQKQDVLMIVSQHNRLGEFSPSTIAQWKIGVNNPKTIVCSGPKYQYPYTPFDQLHMVTDSYRLLGEKYAQVYFERVVKGRNWRPLEPISLRRKGSEVSIKFQVPVKPLVWDSTLGQPHVSSPEWKNGKGFEVMDKDGKRVEIKSAEIRGKDTVVLTLAQDPGPGARVSYAMMGEPTLRNPRYGATPHWGLLRDSDPFVGYSTQQAQPNFCVAFDMKLS